MSLESFLKKQIAQQGPVSVADFMHLALMHPHYGYYQQQQPFGKDGDFVTAPEISQMFGEMVGVWLASIWQQMGSPKELQLVELGPGRGVLMDDILRATEHVPAFHESLSIVMVEQSASLQLVQKEKLTPRKVDISWAKTLEKLAPKPTLFIANEFFDALPIHQYIKTSQGLCERMVGVEEGALAFVVGAPGGHSKAFITIEHTLQENDIVEVSPASVHVMEQIATHIKQFGGAGLFIDYGYEMPATGDTLQAVKHHRYHPVLEEVGTADITAHVNFTALANAAKNAGAKQQQITTQAAFLQQVGIEHRAEALQQHATQLQKEAVQKALHRLMDEKEMGTLFKALMIA